MSRAAENVKLTDQDKQSIRERVISIESVMTGEPRKNRFSPERVMIYVVVNGKLDGSKMQESVFLKNYMNNYFYTDNALYFCLSAGTSAESLFSDFKKEYEHAMDEHKLEHVSAWSIVPIFVYDEAFYDTFRIYCQWHQMMQKYINDNRINNIWLPAVLLPNNDQSNNIPLMKELLSQKANWKNALPVLVIYPQTDNGTILYANRLKTICMTSLLMSCSYKPDVYKPDDENYQCYSARLLTICKPENMEKLLRARSLLSFFTESAPHEEERLRRLGEILSSSLYDSWKQFRGLPCMRTMVAGEEKTVYDNKQISLAPFYSILFPEGITGSEKKMLLQQFADEYYLSRLPLDKKIIQEMGNTFLMKYRSSYGDYLTGMEHLFNEGSQSEFLQKYMVPLSVIYHDINCTDPILQNFAAQTAKTIQDRGAAFCQAMFSTAQWFEKAGKNYYILKDCLMSLKESIDERIRYWNGIEGSIDISKVRWTEEQRGNLMSRWQEVLFSDEPVKQFCTSFCQELFRISGVSSQSAEDYLKHFNDHVENDKVRESWNKLLYMTTTFIAPAQGSSDTNYVMYDTDVFIREGLNKVSPVNQFFGVSDMKDRAEFLAMARGGRWIGEENTDGET